MLFVEDLKPMKIYTKPMYLPTLDGNKKKGSAIFLLTPNYESSKALLNSNLFINNMRFQSYYIEKDLTYFISSKAMEKVDDVSESYIYDFNELDFYQSLYEMSSKERNNLDDSVFGLPKKRKYPLNDKAHVKSAIRFFNYVDEEDEAELARNLNKAIKKFFSAEELPKVGENNRFSKYYHPTTSTKENAVINEGYVKDEPDIYYNKDKYDKGEINLCFITGLMGSGKSTMAHGMENEKLEACEVDDVIYNWEYSDDQLKEKGNLIYSFFKGSGSTYRIKSKDEMDNKFSKNVTVAFVKYAKSYAASHKDTKFVVEGIWFFFFIEPSELKDYAVYIKGTSALKSTFRAIKRDLGKAEEAGTSKASTLKKRMKTAARVVTFDEGKIQKYRVYFNNLQSVNEGTVFTEPDVLYNKDKFESGKCNICFVTGRSGAGKTTITSDITMSLQAAGQDAEDVSLDVVINNHLVDDTYLISYYPMIYSFFKSDAGRRYRLTRETFDSIALRYDRNYDKYDEKLTNVFIDYAIKYAKKHKETKFVVEGVWIALYMEPSYFKDYPVYIKGTSAVTSLYRATVRDLDYREARDQSTWTVLRQKFNSALSITFNNKYNKFYKYYKNLNKRALKEDTVDDTITNTPDTPVESVSAIILSEGRILVEDHVKCGSYTIPGGKINEGESADQTLVRELGEELGIAPIDYTLYFENTFLCEYPTGSGSYTWFKDYCYKILRYEGDIINKEPEKHKSIEFADVDDLMYNMKISKLLQGLLDYMSETEIATFEPVNGIDVGSISCTADEDNIVILKQIATVDTYSSLVMALELPFHNGYPHLRFIASGTNDYKIYENCVDVFVRPFTQTNLTVEDYLIEVLTTAMEALIVYNYPKLENTNVLHMITDFLNGSVSLGGEAIEKLVDKYGSLSALYTVLYQDYGYSTIYKDIKDLGYDFADSSDYYSAQLESARNVQTASSLDSLARSLKYRGSTKVKARISRIRNTTKRLLDQITSSIKSMTTPKIPEVGASPSSSSSSNDSGEDVKESVLRSLDEGSYILNGDYITIFEDATYDTVLKRMLYQERLVKRKDVLALLDRVKSDVPYIKFAFPELDRYQNRNVFIDLYYYNQAFFKNNEWTLKRGFNLYLDFLDRLINDKRIISAGYKRRTVFIPINDWNMNHATRMWMYREGLNPISIIYELMNSNPNGLKKLFNGVEVIFFDKYRYFKVDFAKDTKSITRDAIKFKLFISKINKGEEFEEDDKDSASETTPSKKAIKTDIVDKIEKTKGVDLTDADNEVKAQQAKPAAKKDTVKSDAFATKTPAVKKTEPKPTASTSRRSSTTKAKEEPKKDEPVKSKASKNKPIVNTAGMTDKQVLMTIIKDINDAVDNAEDIDDALDNLDDEDFRDLILSLDTNKDDAVDISASRAERMSQLDKDLLDMDVKGRSIRDILADDEDVEEGVNKKAELPKTSLPVASPNEEWQSMSYINFDKTYDLEKDLVNIFKYWSKVSRPLSIRNIKAEDNSTSEDRVDLYTVEYEDYRGKRYTIKLDIPRMKDGRFLIRGNKKMLQTQFFNMPIVKTDLDTAQIVTNYKKIIIFRYNNASGRSLPNSARVIKALGKYTGKDIKLTVGDNSKVCAKYVLPIDYIDIAGSYSIIETKDYKFYFNQDEIRKEYEVSDSLGVPYGIDKKDNTLLYFSNKSTTPFVDTLYKQIAYGGTKTNEEFVHLFGLAKPPARCTFVMAKIMGSYIPLVVVCAYSEGLTKVLKKANIKYELVDKLKPEQRNSPDLDYIRFSDGYLVYDIDYSSSLLMNGLKDCDTEGHSIMQLDDKNMYLDFLDNYGGRIKADGLDNFYDCEIDPITEETLKYYKLPTDYVSVLLYANYLLADNKFVKHTDTSSRRIRRLELVAAYTYQVLSEVYGSYSTSIKHNHTGATFTCKQSAVIDKIVADPTFSDYSTGNMVNDVECTNAISTKGLSGMNNDRSYNLDKRTYDDSMVGVLGMSTGFSGNVGITRQATLDANVEGGRGYVKSNKGNTANMNTATTLTATESVVPMIANHDDPMRIAMTFIQSSKHSMRTMYSDPLLVTSGSDEAMPYIASDQFAYKAKNDGVIKELNEQYMIIEYKDGSKEYINLTETIEKNSDGGFYVPLKLDADPKLKVGSKVKANDIVAYDKTSVSNSLGETDNLAYNVGKLAKVAILNMDDCYEDAGIMTSKMAHYLATNIIMKHDCVLDKNTNIYNVVKVGSHVEQGDPLLVWQTPYEEDEANALLKALANDKDVVSELGRKSLKAETTGTVVSMKIYRTVETEELSDSLQKLVKEYEKPITELQNRLKKEGIEDTDIPANYPLSPTGKLKGAANGVLIEFYVEYLDTVGVGDKITYNAANKAVMKTIIPEGLEPYTDFRPEEEISAFVSETSITKRLVTSTMIYGSLQKLMVELDRSCKDLAGIEWDHTQA